MLTENQLARRLTVATRRIEADFTIDDLIHDQHLEPVSHLPTPGARRFMAAAALVLIVGLGAALAVRMSGSGSTVGSDQWVPPIALAAAAPIPGSVVPQVSAVPDSVGDIEASRRAGAQRLGHWVGTAAAVPVSNGFEAPISVFAADGSWSALDAAVPITIDGHGFITTAFGDLTVLATTGDPRLVALGRVDPQVLADVLAATRTAMVDGQLALRVERLPAGYVEIVAPTALAEDTPVRRSLTNAARTLSINETSDWASDLLAAASTGSDLERAHVDGRTAWIGRSESADGAPRFLIWSPTPGVIIEIDTTDDSIPTGDLVELAQGTTMVPSEEWDAFYSR